MLNNSMTTWGLDKESALYPSRSMITEAPVPSRPDFDYSVSIGTHYKKAPAFATGAFARDHVEGEKSLPGIAQVPQKIEVLNATVKNIDETFVVVTAAPGGAPVEIQIPIVLCPSDLRMVGMPIAISVDKEARYSSLKITRREKQKEMSPGFLKRLEAMTEWADSL